MDFYTVKEAANITGTSVSSIRRFFEPIRDKDDHELRDQILPPVKEVEKLKRSKKKPNFRWKLSRELLDAFIKEKGLQWPEEGTTKKKEETQSTQAKEGTDLSTLELLQRTVDMLAGQVEKKDEMIAQLLERQHETHVLLKGLQEKIPMLSEPKEVADSAEGGSGSAESTRERAKQSKQSWLARMLKKEVHVFK